MTEPGGPEVLQWRDVPDPQAGPGQVVIDIAAAGINRADVLQRQGSYPPPPGAPEYPGMEVSGRVRTVGEGVTAWAAGDEVCALLGGGGYAQQVAVAATQLLPRPAGNSASATVDLVASAGLPEAVATVWSNLFMVAGLHKEQRLLIHGGASGIGTMAIQLARRAGAHVAVTCGTARKAAACRALGAELTIDYHDEDFVEAVRGWTDGKGADVVLDVIGAKYLARNIEALAIEGQLVVIGLQGGARGELDLGRLLSRRLTIVGTTLRSRDDDAKARIVAACRDNVWPAITTGEVRPVVYRVIDGGDFAAAHRLMAEGDHIGKIVVSIPRSGD